jgi:serine protease AprX
MCPMIPLLLALDELIPVLPGESWPSYRRRARKSLEVIRHGAEDVLGSRLWPLLAANALHGWGTAKSILRLMSEVQRLRISRVIWGSECDDQEELEDRYDAESNIDFHGWRGEIDAFPKHSDRSDERVRVAILDSGVDARHPFLRVEGAVSTCPETNECPGRHGTHCAGLISARHPDCSGLAPRICLFDVKVARANGAIMPSWLAQGIDAALDLRADVLSISLGMNTFPSYLPYGHGWTCSAGECVLCRAVNCAVSCGSFVVAAAGNNHLRVRSLREQGEILSADAELLCPSRSQGALSVGALNRDLASLCPDSSCGSSRSKKPEIFALGEDVESTVPLPLGIIDSYLDLFGVESGTSIATAIVARVVARIIERRRAEGVPCSPGVIREEIKDSRDPSISADAALWF